jgi:hypothetical protein
LFTKRLFMLPYLMLFGITVLISPTESIEIVSGQTIAATSIVSTRNHFDLDTGELQSGQTSTGYVASANIPGLQAGTDCPSEIAIYIHGIWVGIDSLEDPSEIFDRAKKSIAADNYNMEFIGFSWDSDTKISIDGTGWLAAKFIAKENGPKLAQFISDYKNRCQGTDIRLIAHSMGSRVLLSGLDSLYRNQEWNNKNFKIASAHVMGAALDNEEIAKSPSYIISDPSALLDVDEWYDAYGIKLGYGTAIEAEVVKFYNLFNREYNSLEAPILYKFYEQDDALGLQGSSSAILPISNYEEIDVEDQIALIEDADGDGKCDLPMSTPFGLICTIEDIGDNHFGYIGFRDKDGAWVDDGAMNVVIDNWNSLQ